jgi:dienelactone hydrolase
LLLFASLVCVPVCGAQFSAAGRVVDLTAADGTKLKATYFAAAKPGPGVLLLHQCNRQRKVWDDLAGKMSAAGINVLTVDQRGFGESGGEPFAKLPPEEAAKIEAEKRPGDIDTAFQYLVSQTGVTKDTMGVGGASCGFNYSIQAARRHPEVKSLVLLSGSTDVAGRQFLREATKLPAFFAAADDDEFPGQVLIVEWLYSIAADPEKMLAHYATGGHGADMFRVHPELEGRIVDWFVTTLIKTPGREAVPEEAPVLSPEVAVLELIDQPGGADKVAQRLEQAWQKDPKATLFREDVVNIIGYEHLRSGDREGAIAILKLNAEAYPSSPNVYDSLSDAYLENGEKDLARRNARRALELLPSDTKDDQQRRDAIRASAEQKLKQLGEASKK